MVERDDSGVETKVSLINYWLEEVQKAMNEVEVHVSDSKESVNTCQCFF